MGTNQFFLAALQRKLQQAEKKLLCNRPTLPTELESITLMRAGSYVLHPFAEQSLREPTTAYLPSRRKEEICLL